MAQSSILLESGTNEVEFAEFTVGEEHYGINVAKIRRIISFSADDITATPLTHPSVLGVYTVEGRSIPLVDLRQHLNGVSSELNARMVVLVADFNSTQSGFLIDSVNRIFRKNWKDFEPLSNVLTGAPVVGTVRIEDREVLVLDFESILDEIVPKEIAGDNEAPPVEDSSPVTPDAGQHSEDIIHTDIKDPYSRGDVRLLLAEDSHLIREQMVKKLKKAGFTHIEAFETGKDTLDHIEASIGDGVAGLAQTCTALVSDIEMPGMDGLTLCRNIKKTLNLTQLPVILYSSLINEEMVRKCDSVGADGHAVKPKLKELVQQLDRLAAKHMGRRL